MADSSRHPLLQYLRGLSGRAGDAALHDTQLLGRFRASRDESAFTTLVQRYGAMVWGLCVRCLGETPEAEDAFQATFLVLVRKATSLHGPQPLGPWLYGVAYRTALKLRDQRARRAARETPLTEPIAAERSESMWRDLGPILDEEITRLPTKYRLPVLLCCLQGLSSEEAAQRLGCAKGTVFSRLSRARDLLRRRLVRRGVEVSAGAVTAVLTENAVLRAAPSLALREMTVRTGLLLAAGTTGQTLSAPLAALIEGVVRSMFLNKVKNALIVVLAVGIAGSGVGFLSYHTSSAQSESKPIAPERKNRGQAATAPPLVAEAAAPAQKEEARDSHDWPDKLKEPIDYPGIDDQKATVGEALENLSKRFNLTFDINEKAFELDQLKDVGRMPVADATPIPPMRTTLATVLRKILRRVPAPSGATYLIRRDHIEITTGFAVRSELGFPATPDDPEFFPVSPEPQLICDTFQEIPFPQALQRLADSYDYNLVADPQAAEHLRTKITAKLHNVPIETAVRLLANMADLSVVKLDNVYYVTTPAKAESLRKEQVQINADRAKVMVPTVR